MTESYASFMLDHAAGNHDGALELAGDMHMLLNPKGAETAWLWSVIGGAMLEQRPPSEPTNTQKAKPWRRKARKMAQSARDLLAMAESSLEWKRGISGISYATTGTTGAKFIKLKPGQSAPAHGHGSLEATVVLQGQFSDGHGVYKRGDLVLGEPGKRHKPAAVGDETCICFIAETSHPLWNLFR
ncbi:cupin domain-containing protein [Hyphomonas oceanitis]|uniref:Anti-ECFsigma factor ChrR n=1 Tax=Hyphomonas oceanitis SCH89 TaxID=1280953 RepID=A0A059G687_9PROT|nr:cupin domain-containing protein [Hyphomonas oceanitis]KDA02244.1 anti-ECFsigma factor ChrR [Hyphomonas oceanitis SCH89]